MKNYRQFLNENDNSNDLEDIGVDDDTKKIQKELEEEDELQKKREEHDKDISVTEGTEGRVIRKIQFDIDIESTAHAIDRLNRKDADGNAAYEPIDFKEVNAVISKATEDIIDELVNDRMDVNKDRFVLQRDSDGLTVVGVMNSVKDKLKFVVITLFRGDEFRTGKDQKIIIV